MDFFFIHQHGTLLFSINIITITQILLGRNFIFKVMGDQFKREPENGFVLSTSIIYEAILIMPKFKVWESYFSFSKFENSFLNINSRKHHQ